MKNAVSWDITSYGSRKFLQEPHGVTSRKTAFFISILRAVVWNVDHYSVFKIMIMAAKDRERL
jgi:hypothetical protein